MTVEGRAVCAAPPRGMRSRTRRLSSCLRIEKRHGLVLPMFSGRERFRFRAPGGARAPRPWSIAGAITRVAKRRSGAVLNIKTPSIHQKVVTFVSGGNQQEDRDRQMASP